MYIAGSLTWRPSEGVRVYVRDEMLNTSYPAARLRSPARIATVNLASLFAETTPSFHCLGARVPFPTLTGLCCPGAPVTMLQQEFFQEENYASLAHVRERLAGFIQQIHSSRCGGGGGRRV